MLRRTPRRRAIPRRHTAQSGDDLCWRLKQKYDRYLRTGAPIGACREVGEPDDRCLLYGAPGFRVGRLGRNRACTACGRYWIA